MRHHPETTSSPFDMTSARIPGRDIEVLLNSHAFKGGCQSSVTFRPSLRAIPWPIPFICILADEPVSTKADRCSPVHSVTSRTLPDRFPFSLNLFFLYRRGGWPSSHQIKTAVQSRNGCFMSDSWGNSPKRTFAAKKGGRSIGLHNPALVWTYDYLTSCFGLVPGSGVGC